MLKLSFTSILIFPTRLCQAQMSLRCVFYRAMESSVFHARAHICTRPPNIQAFVQHDPRDQYVMSDCTCDTAGVDIDRSECLHCNFGQQLAQTVVGER